MAASAIPCTLWWARKRPSAKCQAQLLPKFSEVSTRDQLPCCQPLCHPVVDGNAAPAGRQLVPQLHSMQSELPNTGGEHHGVNGLPPARPATSRLSIITCVRASQQHQLPRPSKRKRSASSCPLLTHDSRTESGTFLPGLTAGPVILLQHCKK